MKVFLLSLLIFTCGCAALMALIDEGRQIDKEEVSPVSDAVGVLIGNAIPQPYKYPAVIGIGYLLCLWRRVYKKRKGSIN